MRVDGLVEFRSYIREYYNFYDKIRFVNRCNDLLESFGSDYKVRNKRDSSKIVERFSTSPSENKIRVRYNDNTTSTMIIRNIFRNLEITEIDFWDDMDEDKEQDMLIQRLGIKI